MICKITSAKNKYFIEINGGQKIEVVGIDSIVAIKKQLVDSAQLYIV